MSDLVVSSLTKSYPTPAEPLVVLDDVSLTLARGESMAVTGPSGSGKSTLLTILGTLESPTGGSVQLADVTPHELPESELAKFRAEHIGFVFQEHHLLPQCTVLENVQIPLLADGSVTNTGAERARELIDRVGLSERLSHRPAELSGGERQRAAIARALVRGPDLILADEPTGNLDAETADSIASLLIELQKENDAILMVVTHSEDLAAKMAKRARLRQGKLVD